jgi:hypothetical protein
MVEAGDMGRATEFLDFLTSDNINDTTYSNLEIRDGDEKIAEKYLKIRREYLKQKKDKQMTPSDYYERYCNWYKLTLCKIANADDQANPMHLKELAQTALDGEPTSDVKYTKEDVKIDFKDKSREKRINMISSIGYRGEE